MIAATSPEVNLKLADHFSEVTKMITIGKGGKRKTKDYFLSRRACYLIAQNGDPEKPEIASAQNYFAFTECGLGSQYFLYNCLGTFPVGTTKGLSVSVLLV